MRRGSSRLRDLPVLVWLLGVPVVAVLRTAVPAPRWLLLHLLLLGAATHAILVWSRHFAEAVLHTRPPERDRQGARLVLLDAGVALVVVGVPSRVWPLTATGAAAVAVAVCWHAESLLRLLRSALPARFRSTVHCYVAAAAFLPVGALLGTLLAHQAEGPWHARMMVAHAVVNLLGWVGLTVVGTLVTLWPTMLRTRLVPGAERATRQAVPVLAAAVAGTAGAALAGSLPLTGLGLGAYLAGLVVVGRPFVATARRKPPSSYPTWSVLAGTAWLAVALVVAAVGLGTAGSWEVADERLSAVTPLLAAGFVAQVLLGALSYLVPTVLGGGPSRVRVANGVLESAGPARLVLVNAGLVLLALPLPTTGRGAGVGLAVRGLVWFLVLVGRVVLTARRAEQAKIVV